MAQGARPERGGAGKGGQPRRSNDSRGRRQQDAGRPDRQGRGAGAGASSGRGGSKPRSGERRDGAPERRGGPRSTGQSKGRPTGRSGGPTTGRSGGRDRDRDRDRTEAQQRYDGPPIPEHITGRELSRSVRDQLRSLPEKLSERVARHLAAAQEFLETDPAVAYEHTLAARARASRLAVVREAVGEAAYHAGRFSEALVELRAARRMNGAPDYIPMMADCERALGRPDKALTLLRNAPRERFGPDLAAEAVIVEAGARLDRGEIDAALRTLERAPLNSKARAAWVVRLRYAYADALLAAGRKADALTWFHRTVAIDGEETTDASDRAAELERELG